MYQQFTHRLLRVVFNQVSVLFAALVVLFASISAENANAGGDGYRGWKWDGQYYGSASAACRAMWVWARQDEKEGSRLLSPEDRPGFPFSKQCKWTYNQYLCPQETQGLRCGTVHPARVSLDCEYGYVRSFPNRCVRPEELRAERPPCGYGGGGKQNPTVGNPIILNNGTNYHMVEDFSTSDGRLFVSRSYRSNPIGRNTSVQYMPLGLPGGWQFNFAMELQLGTFSGSPSSPDANVTLISPDGSAYDFALNSSGVWEIRASSGSVSQDYSLSYQGTLPSDLSTIKSSSSNWVVVGPDDRTWNLQTFAGVNTTTLYDIARPTSVADRTGYTWTYAYDASDNRLLSITDTYNRALSFTWSYFYITTLTGVAGSLPYPEVISEITFPDGTKASYEFDPVPASSAPSTDKAERLVAIRWKDSSGTVVDSETYHYEDTNFVNALTGITDGRNLRVSTYAYDTRGRTVSTEGAGGNDKYTIEYGTSGGLETRRVTNPLGKVSVYKFSQVGSSAFDLQFTGVDGEASTHCVASNSSYTYDSNNYVATKTDEEGRVTTYVRDGEGRPTQITEATGTTDERITTITWHTTYNVPTSIVRPGLTTTYTYNTAGRLTGRTETDTTTHTVPYSTASQTRVWTYTYTTNDLLQSIDGPRPGAGDTVSYTYDANGYVATFTNEVGHVYTALATNGRGQPTSLQDPNNIVQSIGYDDRGRITSIAVDPTGLNAQTTYEYDAAGNLTKLTEPDGSLLEFEYDANDRVTKVTNNESETVNYTYDLMGNVTLADTRSSSGTLYFRMQSAFDELGRLRQVTRAGSANWTYGYDKVGNLLSVTDPNSNATTSTYDNLDRLISFADEYTATTTWAYGDTDYPVSTTDPHPVTTSYVRNGWGEAIQEQSNDIGTIVYERDEYGRITKRTDARGVVVDFVYDDAGRRTSTSYPSETGSNVTFTRDSGANGVGRLTGVTDAAGTLSRTYDALGRVVQESRTIGSQTYVTAYQWSDAGKLTQITYPSGRLVVIGRDSNGEVANVVTKQSSLAADVGLAWWVNDTPFGPRHGLLHGNVLTDWRTYDTDGRLSTQTLTDNSVSPANVLLDRTYHYVDKRNLNWITDNLDSTRNENYWYTDVGMLQNAIGPWGALTFYVDGVGNITHRILDVGGTTTTDVYQIPFNSNRLNGTYTNGVQSRIMASDAAGNVITDTDVASSVSKTLGYNAAGQLASVVIGSQPEGQYVYDYLSRLTIRTLPASSTTLHYVHDLDGNIIAEYDSSGTVAREYIWMDERPLAVVSDAGTASPMIYHVHTDHLERPIMMTDTAKNIVWKATYLPFGGIYTITGSATLNQRFPGQWFQLESGLHYNWHRHFDPTTGRYIQPDPLGMPDGPSRWAYVNNSPLMYTDPLGLQTTPPPPARIPGGPWRWAENPGDGRQGRWHGKNGATANWDKPGGHWDVDDGKRNRTRYNRHGSPMTPKQAHGPYKGPPRQPFLRWPKVGPFFIIPPTSPEFWCPFNPSHPSCCET